MNIRIIGQIALLTLSVFLLFSCAVLNPDDYNATNEARVAATPKAKPERTITNFTRALQCMDNLFVRYNISDLLVGAQDVVDPTSKSRVPTKDMLITALSKMSQRSKAIRFVVLGYDLQDISTYHNLHKSKEFSAPDFFIRISSPQFDKGVASTRIGAGIRVQDAFSTEGNKDRMLSIASIDMNLGVTKTLQMIPGLSSSNSIAVVRKGLATDLSGTIEKFGSLFQISYDTSEGLNHSLRTLIDLGAIELMGSLAQVPYWECLDIESNSPEVQSKLYDWFQSLSASELRIFIQSKLEALDFYKGPVDGKDSEVFRQAVVLYKGKVGLIVDSSLDFGLYYQLITDQTPIKSAYLPLLTQRIKDPSVKDGEPREKIVEQNISVLKNSIKPLELMLSTNRGVTPIVRAGELISVRVSVTTDAYVYCYYHQADGKVLKLFPNRYRPDPKVSPDEELFIPGGHFKLQADIPNSREQVMCIASYNEIDKELPTELRERNLEVIPVANLESVYQYYKMVANIVPLQKTITIEVR